MIKGAMDFQSGKTKDFSQVGVKALNPTTVAITLDHADSTFLLRASQIAYAPQPRAVIERHGKNWTRPENMVGNGPYVLDIEQGTDKVVLAKNWNYHAAAQVRIPTIIKLAAEDENVALRHYQAGNVDYTGLSSLEGQIGLLRKRFGMEQPPSAAETHPSAQLFTDPRFGYTYIPFNLNRPPFDNPKVRWAIALAIDEERISKHMFKGLRPPMTSMLPDLLPDYTPVKMEETYNPEKARQLLAEAGYPNGIGFPKIVFQVGDYALGKSVAAFIQRSLKEVLGIAMEVDSKEFELILQNLKNGDFDLAMLSNGYFTRHPHFLEVSKTGHPDNDSRYHNPQFDQLLAGALSTLDPELQRSLYHDAEELVTRDLPFYPLVQLSQTYLKRTHVFGLWTNTAEYPVIKDATLGLPDPNDLR